MSEVLYFYNIFQLREKNGRKRGQSLTFLGWILFWIILNDSALFVDLGKINSRKINTWSISSFDLYPLEAFLDDQFFQNQNFQKSLVHKKSNYNLRVVQILAILFLKSMSERGGSDTDFKNKMARV